MEYRGRQSFFAIPAAGCQTKADVVMLLGRRVSFSAAIMGKLDTLQAHFFPMKITQVVLFRKRAVDDKNVSPSLAIPPAEYF